MTDEGGMNRDAVERIVRIEEKQDHVVEKIDEIHSRIEEDVDRVDGRLETIEKKTRRLWYIYQALKWAGGSAGLLASVLSSFSL